MVNSRPRRDHQILMNSDAVTTFGGIGRAAGRLHAR